MRELSPVDFHCNSSKIEGFASWSPRKATPDAAAFRMSVGDVFESTGCLVALTESLRRSVDFWTYFLDPTRWGEKKKLFFDWTELSRRCEFGHNFGSWWKVTFRPFLTIQNYVQTRSDGWEKWHWVKGLAKIKFKICNPYYIALLSSLRLYCTHSRSAFLICNVVRPFTRCHFSQPSDRVWT